MKIKQHYLTDKSNKIENIEYSGKENNYNHTIYACYIPVVKKTQACCVAL